jgi:hypothetical protein
MTTIDSRKISITLGVVIATLAGACHQAATAGSTGSNTTAPSAPAPGDHDMVSTALELASDGQGWTLAFRIKNTTTQELKAQILEPFVSFELEVTSDKGDRLSIAQPAFHVPGRPRALVLAPGAEVRVETPFHLRFDPTVSPAGGSDPMVWSIRSAKVPALARATFEISGLGAQQAQARLD